MLSMTTQEADPIDIDPSLVGTLELAGFDVPYVDLEAHPHMASRLAFGGTQYTFDSSFPTKGHSAVMPAAIAEHQQDGKRILVAERGERYYVYLA